MRSLKSEFKTLAKKNYDQKIAEIDERIRKINSGECGRTTHARTSTHARTRTHTHTHTHTHAHAHTHTHTHTHSLTHSFSHSHTHHHHHHNLVHHQRHRCCHFAQLLLSGSDSEFKERLAEIDRGHKQSIAVLEARQNSEVRTLQHVCLSDCAIACGVCLLACVIARLNATHALSVREDGVAQARPPMRACFWLHSPSHHIAFGFRYCCCYCCF
jgi:hypothetical protein